MDHRPTEPVAANADLRTPTTTPAPPAPPARTADGVDLFAAAPATRFQDLLRPVDDDDPVAETDRVPTPVGVGAATDGTESVTAEAHAQTDTADSSADVRELLQRIADLRAP